MRRFILLSLLGLGACSASNGLPQSASAKTPPSGVIRTSEGKASYYGGRHNGRTTSSGRRFDSTRLTAAHRTLPFGTVVTVTNLMNNRSCDVEITDRGPAVRTGRTIDVSESAARCLEMIRSGVAPVRLRYAG